jgi:hypothetical protein
MSLASQRLHWQSVLFSLDLKVLRLSYRCRADGLDRAFIRGDADSVISSPGSA